MVDALDKKLDKDDIGQSMAIKLKNKMNSKISFLLIQIKELISNKIKNFEKDE